MKINKLTFGPAIIISVLFALVGGAFSQKVTYNYLPGTNFANYRTYKWVRVEKAQYPNQLLDEQIMRSIDAQLAQKGLRRDDEGVPDLAVVYQAAVNQERQWNAYSSGGSYWG